MAFVCPTILSGPGKGRTRNLENVTMRLVPIFSAQSLPHTMLGAGLDEDGECVEEDRGLLGIHVFPRAGPVGGAGVDKNGHIPDKK